MRKKKLINRVGKRDAFEMDIIIIIIIIIILIIIIIIIIAICNKKERQWLIFEGTVCNIGQIQERDKLKTEKYADLRASLKKL